MIGTHSLIFPDVHIENNVAIGAKSVVIKDIPDDCVAWGLCKVIGDFDSIVLK